ncbi:ATP synthase subunit s-like protein [Caenorhabditis elegans]|uniref:ATP synthase subunit s-like protein n=1 Tax=Caenorhabditis elegans TaxID=6239 RepID=A0A7R9XN32_CAEEL|nr:Mitochondrial ATP synthase regulatory component factor B [Caenorhabditis elegans]CAD8126359.1 Mitochondrial ATP synthase regulatory component factor B [Caenorhabditis elegans]
MNRVYCTARSFRTSVKSNGWVHKWSRFKRWQEMQAAHVENVQEKQRNKNFIRLPTGLYITPERPDDLNPKKAPADMTRKDTGQLPMELLTWHTQMRYVDHSIDNIKRYRRYKKVIPERLLFLGPDLAAAHFLVHRGAAVKFVGDDNWYKKDKWNRYSLPGRKVDNLFIEAIDASGTQIMFEGLENLENLQKLRLLRLANSEYVDDWCIGRIGGLLPNLEMLDLSGCHRISSKGLMGLKASKNLKFLRLEGLSGIRNLGKSALILEDLLPKLQILGMDYELSFRQIEAENRLLEQERVVLDGRGNAFVEDDNSRLFLVMSTSSDDKAVTDDHDNPIMTSTVRREIPKMDDAEFEEINALSGGKLRHLLVGSPSGYEWTETTERILEHEAELNLTDNVITDPKMLPRGKRPEFELPEHRSRLEDAKAQFLKEFGDFEENSDKEQLKSH